MMSIVRIKTTINSSMLKFKSEIFGQLMLTIYICSSLSRQFVVSDMYTTLTKPVPVPLFIVATSDVNSR